MLFVTFEFAGNEVKELKYVVDLQAVGAMKQLGAGLRILGINKSNVENPSFIHPSSSAGSKKSAFPGLQ